MATPHDGLFKDVFKYPENAAGLLRSNLPEQIAREVDFESLTLVPGSFVDEKLVESHTDLLFSAMVAGTRCSSTSSWSI